MEPEFEELNDPVVNVGRRASRRTGCGERRHHERQSDRKRRRERKRQQLGSSLCSSSVEKFRRILSSLSTSIRPEEWKLPLFSNFVDDTFLYEAAL
jgi:hypothetical protein